ncbi:MAG: type I DNA topoisomerase [Candidatus Gracilibacteria bacterium]|nr:type I DNA topoisomerase [Candidatus Gracilibacteria bacterium]MDD2908524.1 type I DNA topoisomerase [Candidatus Gracilibacteria bacterium]
MKNLVIVESPAKGKTIEKYLGKDFIVKASFGHIRDLPKKELGIDIDNKFTPTYEISEEKKKVVNELKKLVKEAETVWIATDEDREGEAIGWHLCKALGLDENTVNRIVFHEITKSAIDEAIKNPRKLDINMVNAQQCRRLLDRLVGFKTSPVLWKKIQKGLSAGRVQSVAVKLIIEREREINAFNPEESWKVKVSLTGNGITFIAEFAKISGKGKKIKSAEEVQKFIATLGVNLESLEQKKDKKGNAFYEIPFSDDFKLIDADKKDTVRLPGAPFTTSTLQQEASRKLGFGVSQTMTVAQMLYQNGHITYMRTDSVNLSDLAIANSKKYIDETFGKEYSLPNGRKFKTKQANAQEAHEAIRPAYIDKTPDMMDLEGNELRLYKLIWERTVASQMQEAQIETTTYNFSPIGKEDQEWISKGEVIKFPGFMKLYTEGNDDELDEEEGMNLPLLNKGDIVKSNVLNVNQNFSRPPSRYTEAMLVKKLESEGIGRPSTYAPTITTIIDRGYVEKIEKKLAPRNPNDLKGIPYTVNDFLDKYFPEMMDYKFTAKIEEEFDEVSAGKIDWIQMLEKFYTNFKIYLDKTMTEAEKVVEEVGRDCPDCEGGRLIYKYSKTGKFIGCSNFPKCKYLENVAGEANPDNDKMAELKEKYEGKECEAGGTIVVKIGRFGPFLASSLYPEVKWIGKIPNEKNIELEGKFGGKTCEKCGTGIMHVKSSRRGPFLACSNYPECKNAQNLPKDSSESQE